MIETAGMNKLYSFLLEASFSCLIAEMVLQPALFMNEIMESCETQISCEHTQNLKRKVSVNEEIPITSQERFRFW